MTAPSPFEAPEDPGEMGEAWRKPVCWLLKLTSLGLIGTAVLVVAFRLFLFVVGAMEAGPGWVASFFVDCLCWLGMLGLPASALWVVANAIGYPDTHALPVLDHNELRVIYAANTLQDALDGDPGDYANLSDRDLVDVYSAINPRAKRYPELMAAIKRRIEEAETTDDEQTGQ